MEEDASVRACLWLGLGLDPANANSSQLDTALDECDDELERWAVGATLVRLRRADAPLEALNSLLESLQEPSVELEEGYSELPFSVDGIEADSAALLAQLGAEAKRFREPLCEALSRVENVFQATMLLETILPLFFGEFSKAHPVRWEVLDEDGRAMLRALVATDSVWGDGEIVFVNLSQLMEQVGLPYNREQVRTLTGMP